jgi:hypothetical protein
MIEVDLNVRVLPRNHEVFYARPGTDYKFYHDFIQEKAIFLDLPSLMLGDEKLIIEEQDLNWRLKRSLAIKKWRSRNREGDAPSRKPGDYFNDEKPEGGSQLRAAIEAYFSKAKKGDLVIITPSAYSSLAYIGEFTAGPNAVHEFRVDRVYGNEPLPGRKVRWKGTIEKRFLDAQVLEISQKPNIIVTLPRSKHRYIYDLVYNGYTFEDDFIVRFDVTEDRFTSHDDMLMQAFLNYVALSTKNFAEKSKPDKRSFHEAAFIDSGSYTPDLKVEVSSPGFLSVLSSKITPLVASVLFVIAVDVGVDALQAAEEGKIRIGNSQAPADDACVADVEAQAMNAIKLSGEANWPAICEAARQLKHRNGIKGPSNLRQ